MKRYLPRKRSRKAERRLDKFDRSVKRQEHFLKPMWDRKWRERIERERDSWWEIPCEGEAVVVTTTLTTYFDPYGDSTCPTTDVSNSTVPWIMKW